MRLIDADALMDEIAVLLERNEELIDGWLAGVIDDTIEQAPTVDAVDVVRCGDCRWYKEWKIIGRDDGYCGYARMTRDGLQYINTNADDFCSYGERRTE